jgi:acyl carrier protein
MLTGVSSPSSGTGTVPAAALHAGLQRQYAASWQREFRPRLQLAAAFAHVAMRPLPAAGLMSAVRLWPGLLTRGARWGAARYCAPVQSHSGCHGRNPMNTTFQRLCHLLVQDYKLPQDRLSMETALEGLGIDSLGTVELLWSIEETFLIKVPSRPANLLTLGDVVRYIDELVALQLLALRRRWQARSSPRARHEARGRQRHRRRLPLGQQHG